MKTYSSIALLSLLSVGLFFSRVMPHEANFTPTLAICLFIGFLAKGRGVALVLPMLALICSDIYLGLYSGWALNTLLFLGLILMGSLIKPKALSVAGFSLAGAISFFIVSNLGVWAFTSLYPKSLEGLLTSYQMAVPFFRMTLASTLVYSGVLFVAWNMIQKLVKAKAWENA